jgi:tRNA pseudouridine13 synthase
VPATAEPRVQQLEADDCRVLKVSRHVNKLKPGHLRGNRFQVRIRNVALSLRERTAHLERLVAELRTRGLPNYYGDQRFGRDDETLSLGLRILRREGATSKKFLKKLALSAVQAALFNVYLAERLGDGLLHRVLAGDVLARWPVGGMFVAKDVATEQGRFDAREIVSAGPMFGVKTFPALDDALMRERDLLARVGLSMTSFAGFGKLLQGTRRHNLVYVDDLEARQDGEDVLVHFSLPAGSYATVLLREIVKTEEKR